MTDTTTITVSGDASYPITVGRGILSLLGDLLPAGARKVLVVHPPTLAAQAEQLRDALKTAGVADSGIELKKPETATGSGNNAEARRVEVVIAQ